MEGTSAHPVRQTFVSRHPLDNIQVAKPCPVSWDSMSGDDRVRFCSDCRLNVYNLAGMTRREATDLIYLQEGRLCVRFFRRKDGMLVTRDCPVRWSWTAGLARMAALFLGISVPFWGAVVCMNWKDLHAVFYGWVDPNPIPPRHETMGIMIPAIERPPLRSWPQPDTERTADESDGTPPSRVPPEVR